MSELALNVVSSREWGAVLYTWFYALWLSQLCSLFIYVGWGDSFIQLRGEGRTVQRAGILLIVMLKS